MGFRFDTEENTEKYLNVLLNASALSGGKFEVFTHKTMPERWHFVSNERIAPIYVVPKIGYALTDRIENGSGMNKGVRIVSTPAGLLKGHRGIILTLCAVFRATDTITAIKRCTPCSSHTGPSRRS